MAPGLMIIDTSDIGVRGIKIDTRTFEVSMEGFTALAYFWPYWLSVAGFNYARAHEARDELQDAVRTQDIDSIRPPLREELAHTMTVVVALAAAFDNFYHMVSPKIPLPANVIQSWKRNKRRKPHSSYVMEVLKHGFQLRQPHIQLIGPTLRELYTWRNWAIHPSADMQAVRHHPLLDAQVEWRFVAFSLENATALMDFSFQVLPFLLAKPKPQLKDLRTWCESSKQLMPPRPDLLPPP